MQIILGIRIEHRKTVRSTCSIKELHVSKVGGVKLKPENPSPTSKRQRKIFRRCDEPRPFDLR